MAVKIGSSTVVGADGKVNRAFIGGLADQAAALRKLGWRLVVVSSGAIACGYPVLGFDRKPVGDLPSLQACASAGQCIISSAYDEEFHARDLLTSLVLLTRHDTARRTSYLHARDALLRLVELGVVPVVNENDTVTVDEIKFGDNDTLAALVSCLVSADLCVTLSDIDGLYTANPHEDPTAEFVPVVHKIDAKIIASAGDSSTSVGTGGMITKIRASRILMTAGIQSVICSGEEPDALVRLARGESVGTLFDPPAERLDIAPRKLWIALGDKAHGSVTVDDGAAGERAFPPDRRGGAHAGRGRGPAGQGPAHPVPERLGAAGGRAFRRVLFCHDLWRHSPGRAGGSRGGPCRQQLPAAV